MHYLLCTLQEKNFETCQGEGVQGFLEERIAMARLPLCPTKVWQNGGFSRTDICYETSQHVLATREDLCNFLLRSGNSFDVIGYPAAFSKLILGIAGWNETAGLLKSTRRRA